MFSIIIKRFLTAVRFMTIVPIGWKAEEDSDYFKDCYVFFPVVGLLIGSCGWGITELCLYVFPQQVVAVIALIYLSFISGFLHLDGLSDSADGLLSARPRTRALEIMKDSRVGAMGVVALFFLILTKYAALSSMTKESLALAVFFMPIVGRSMIVIIMATQKYARSEGGLGHHFYAEKGKQIAIISSLTVLLLFAVLSLSRLPFFVILATLALLSFHRWCQVKLGGATGDTLGAICEIGEMVTAISFSVSLAFL